MLHLLFGQCLTEFKVDVFLLFLAFDVLVMNSTKIKLFATQVSNTNQNKYIHHLTNFRQEEYWVLFWSAVSTLFM